MFNITNKYPKESTQPIINKVIFVTARFVSSKNSNDSQKTEFDGVHVSSFSNLQIINQVKNIKIYVPQVEENNKSIRLQNNW